MVQSPVVELDPNPGRGAPGLERHDRSSVHRSPGPPVHGPLDLERGHQRTRRQRPNPANPGPAARRRLDIGSVKVAAIGLGFDAEQPGKGLAGLPVGQGDQAVPSHGDPDQAVVHHRACGPDRVRQVEIGPGSFLHLQPADLVARQVTGPPRHPDPIDLVEVGVVPESIDSFQARRHSEDLHRHRRPIRADQMKGPIAEALVRLPIPERPDENIPIEPRRLRHHDAGIGAAIRIPDRQHRPGSTWCVARHIGIVANPFEHCRLNRLGGQSRNAVEPNRLLGRDRVRHRTADGVVKLGLDQRPPGLLHHRAPPQSGRGHQHRLGRRMAAGQPAPTGVRTRQRPDIAGRVAQLTPDRLKDGRRRQRRVEVLGQAAESHHRLRFERLDLFSQGREAGSWSMMIRADEHGDVRRDGPGHQLAANRGPVFRETGPDFVSLRRQVIRHHRSAARPHPPVEIAFDPADVAEPSPNDPPFDAELGRQIRQSRRVSERVGTVEHRTLAAQIPGHRDPDLEILPQRHPGRDQLIGQDIPWTQPELTPPGQRLDGAAGPRHHREVVLDQNHLAIEMEAERRGRFEQFEESIHHRNQPGQECAPGEIPFPVPVDVGDQMERDWGHSARILRPVRSAAGTPLGVPRTWRTKASHQSCWGSRLRYRSSAAQVRS